VKLSSLRTSPSFYCLLALLILWTPLVWGITQPFVTSLLLGLVLSVVIYPFYQWSVKGVKRPGIASAIATLVTLVAVAGLVTVIGIVLSQEVTEGYRRLDEKSAQEGGWSAFANHIMDRSVEFVAARTNTDEASLREQASEGLRRAATATLGLLRTMVTALTAGLVNFFFASIFVYFFLKHGPQWVEKVVYLLPLESTATWRLLNTLKDSIIANVNGVLVVAIAQGFLLFLGFYFAGIGGAFLWALIGGIASVIPIVGATVVWIPCVIWLLVQGEWVSAALLATWCAVVVGSSDNVLRPLVVGGRVQQHPVLIGLAMIGGAQAFGAAGVLIGPVALSFFFAVVREMAVVAEGECGVTDLSELQEPEPEG
jgi:predicted PurR-regulated permease PerM